jgi:hypothetical protein
MRVSTSTIEQVRIPEFWCCQVLHFASNCGVFQADSFGGDRIYSRPDLASRSPGVAPCCAGCSRSNRVVEHLEMYAFEIDETDQVMRKRPLTSNHS